MNDVAARQNITTKTAINDNGAAGNPILRLRDLVSNLYDMDSAGYTQQTGKGVDPLAPARTMLPVLTQRQMERDAAAARLDEVPDPGLLKIWRLDARIYLGGLVVATMIIAIAAYTVIGAMHPGIISALAALGFAANIVGLAHLAGGWAKRMSGAHGYLKKTLAILLEAGVIGEIAALAHILNLTHAGTVLVPLVILAFCTAMATVAAWLRHHPSPEIGRLLENMEEAQARLDVTHRRFTDEVAAARASFEDEIASLEEAAARAGNVGDAITGLSMKNGQLIEAEGSEMIREIEGIGRIVNDGRFDED